MSHYVHDWETGGRWGVIIGVSKCKICGKVSRESDFSSTPRTCIVDEGRTCPPTSRYDCSSPCPYVGYETRLERGREVEQEIRKGMKEKEGE